MSTEWITDRLPTAEDGFAGDVWITDLDGELSQRYFARVALGRPWQPIHKPAPYVKPKRWKVEWCKKIKYYEIRYNGLFLCHVPELICDEIAQRIEDLFNEVMP